MKLQLNALKKVAIVNCLKHFDFSINLIVSAILFGLCELSKLRGANIYVGNSVIKWSFPNKKVFTPVPINGSQETEALLCVLGLLCVTIC